MFTLKHFISAFNIFFKKTYLIDSSSKASLILLRSYSSCIRKDLNNAVITQQLFGADISATIATTVWRRYLKNNNQNVILVANWLSSECNPPYHALQTIEIYDLLSNDGVHYLERPY